MENQENAESVLFRYVRQDIALIYDLFFDYVARHSEDSPPFLVPDTFTLVSAFACVFHDLKVVSGKHFFISSIDEKHRKVCLSVRSHYWLAWRDNSHIIDVLPLDGKFGISVPQAIIQNSTEKRFFSQPHLYPKKWGIQKKTEFERKVNNIVVILEELMEKVPL